MVPSLRQARIALWERVHKCTIEGCKYCAEMTRLLADLEEAARADERRKLEEPT